MKLKLRPSDLKKIDAHALKTFPHECCGLLVGTSGSEGIEVKEVVEGENVLGSPVAFEASPEFVYKVYKRAEERGLQLVGIYHSHPNLHAFVSSRDAEIMRYWEGLAWLIIGLSRDRIVERKAFEMKEGKVNQLEIVVI